MNIQPYRQQYAGYTLLETLIVFGIIGLLASLSLPLYISAKASAHKTKCIHNLKEIGLELFLYDQSESSLPQLRINVLSEAPYDPSYFDNSSPDAIAAHSLRRHLMNSGFSNANYDIWHCPGNCCKINTITYSSYTPNLHSGLFNGRRSLTDLDSPSTTWVLSDMNLAELANNNSGSAGFNEAEPNTSGSIGIPASATEPGGGTIAGSPFVTIADTSNFNTNNLSNENLWPVHIKGKNFLFADGHVEHRKLGNYPTN